MKGRFNGNRFGQRLPGNNVWGRGQAYFDWCWDRAQKQRQERAARTGMWSSRW